MAKGGVLRLLTDLAWQRRWGPGPGPGGRGHVVERDLRQRLFEHLQDMHLGYLVDHPPSELMATSIGLVLGASAVGFMLYISSLLTILAMLPMPLIVVLTPVQSGRLYRRYQEVQEAFGRDDRAGAARSSTAWG